MMHRTFSRILDRHLLLVIYLASGAVAFAVSIVMEATR